MHHVIPKLLLQNTFQYYPSIKGYNLQKVSSLQDCNPNFKAIRHPEHNASRKQLSAISKFPFWGNKWPKSMICHHLPYTPKPYLLFSHDWWKNYSFWNFILYV
jgi:hypothetical protein